jgi:hypothetical protein
MAKSRNQNFFIPDDDSIRRIMDNLTKYPVCPTDKKTTQRLGRYKWTRRQKKNNNIYINNGIISIPNTVTIQRKGNGYELVIR